MIKKHRYSVFFGTDLDIILRGLPVETVVIAGGTVESCRRATSRDALFRNYKAVVLSDGTASRDYPEIGWGALAAEEVKRATLVVLAGSTRSVMSTSEFVASFRSSCGAHDCCRPHKSRTAAVMP